MCVPAPAVAGLNELPLTPGPLQVPPATLAVSARAAELWHMAALLLVIARSPVLPKVSWVKALPPPSTQATSSIVFGPRNTLVAPVESALIQQPALYRTVLPFLVIVRLSSWRTFMVYIPQGKPWRL